MQDKEILQAVKDWRIPSSAGFMLEGNNGKAVLLCHGYTGSPGEMRPLGGYLNKLGYTVVCPRLPGHGTNLEDCEKSTAEDWYKEVVTVCLPLTDSYKEVYVAGLSMGGLLAIKLAAELPVKKAVFMAPPIKLRDKRVPLFPILKYFIRYLPKFKKDLGEMKKYNITYTKLPTKPLGSLFALQKECIKKHIPNIKIPCLIMQSKIEKTVAPEGAQYLYDHLKLVPEQKKLVWFENCGHILTLDSEREQVYQEIAEFFAKEAR